MTPATTRNGRGDRPAPTALAGRHELRGVLGAGRSGLVYRAFDRRLGRVVALKMVRAPDADALYRLKRELRTLARLAHPNLVSFFDLVVDGGERFFTMELVEGADFVDAFRSRLAAGEPATAVHADLRTALVQLAGGLDALHRRGMLHRDVKPGNVLVTDDGRVVLLDFGLALDVGADDEALRGTAGTMGHLAPEQIAGQPASTAGDWFGAGLMLYEALTGRLPYDGATLLDVLSGKACPPTPPGALEPPTPHDLEALALALLEPDPGRRPVGSAVVARLAHPAEIPAECEPPPTRGPLVGRVAEMAELDDALERSRSGACALLLRGVSGIGKTALAESFVRHAAAERGALVLAARCHPYEAIPFRALDGVIDALARHLARLGDDAVELLLPDDVAAVRRIFPVLGRVPRIARAVARRGAGVDPAMDRQESFTALRSLLSRIAAHRPVILWIDDAHCGDRDSAALLGELLRVPVSSRILLLLSFGEEQGTAGPLVEALRGSAAASLEQRSGRELQLGPLSVDHVAALVRSVIGDGAPIPAERLAAEAQGSPLLALEVARELAEQRTTGRGRIDVEAPSVVSVIARRVGRLPQVARDVLELLAVAGGPLDRAVARRALGAALAQVPTIRGELDLRPALGVELDPRPELRAKLDPRPALGSELDPRPALALLHARRLARPVPRGDEMADAIDHDRIQEAVLALLPPMRRRALHLSLAGALGSDGDPRVLVHHYEQAGQHERAAELALAAGRRAEDDLAFDQAAELYARALALGTGVAPAWGLHERIGRMLTLAGRAAEAAEHLAAAADALEATVPSDARSVALRRRAAEHYLRSGRYDAGLAALRASLRASAVRYPRTAPGAVLSALARRALLALVSRLGSVWDPAYRFASGRGPAKTAAVSDREQAHLELYWSATVGLSLFDVVRAVDFQLRHTLLARRTGDPRHLARALATEAGILVWEGGARTRARALQILDDAERLATSVGDPGVELLVLAGRSTVAFGARRFRESLSWCEQALRLGQTRHVGTPWETVNLEIGAITALVGMGELGRARTRTVEAQQRAQEWGDIYGSVALRLGTVAFVWLAADDPDQVQRQVAEARAAAPLPPFQEYCAAYAEAQADIYAGNAARAWRATGAEWSRLRHRLLLRIEGVRLDLLETRARAALALAAQPGSQRAAMLRFVRRAAWRMAHQRADWILPSVSALRAGVAWLQGDRTSAITGLGEAAAGFDRLDMRMHAAAARLHLARLGVGEPVESCADAMRLLGAVHPPRLAAALVPGFPDLERAAASA